jgi:hypothetical protein
MLFAILLGIALAIVFVLLARLRVGRHARSEPRVLAVGLVVAALIYVVFALVGHSQLRWHLVEVVGLVLFAFLAWWGVRREPIWLAVGWVLHVGWDLGLHGTAETFVPGWYPAMCVGFDVFVAGYILGRQASGWAGARPDSSPSAEAEK